MICLETLHESLEGIILVNQMHKISFILVTHPKEAVLSCLLPIFVCYFFFDVSLFLENH